MTIEQIKELIIPGFALLSFETRVQFESTSEGELFNDLSNSTFQAYNNLQKSFGIFSLILGTFDVKKKALQDEFLKIKSLILDAIKNSDEYKKIKSAITIELLKDEMPDIDLLSEQDRYLLCSDPQIQSFTEQLDVINKSIKKESEDFAHLDMWARAGSAGRLISERINELENTRNQLRDSWKSDFLTQTKFTLFRTIIEQKNAEREFAKITKRARELVNFFPLLRYRKSLEEDPIIVQLRDKYSTSEWTKKTPPITLVDDISDLFFHYMKNINKVEVRFINLDSFNKKQAHEMAKKLLQAFNQKSPLNMAAWFDEYSTNLSQFISEALLTINGKKFTVPKPYQKKKLINALSFIWKNPAFDKANQFASKLGDAHAFMQATSFSSQNENAILGMLDIYNYARFHENIAETKTIISSLLQPFGPIMQEYKDIGLYEQNILWKFVRILAPILIIVATIVLLTFFLTPLALPELVFIAALIPELLIGMGLTTIYVSVKNEIYKFLRESFYGGAYEIPEFQLNPRMTAAFGSIDNAKSVREHYIAELKKCDQLEENYRLKSDKRTLTQQELVDRKANTIKRHELNLEWYDIHTNKDLGFDFQLTQIVLSNLQRNIIDEYKVLEEAVTADLNSINTSAVKVTTDLKVALVDHNKRPPLSTDGTVDEAATVIKGRYTPGLFKAPSALKHNFHIEDMVNLSEKLSPATV